jgi:hypothetical protein
MPQNQFENHNYQITLIKEKAKSDVSLVLLRLGNDYNSLQRNNDISANQKTITLQRITLRSVGELYKIYETRNRALEALGIVDFEDFPNFIKLEDLPTGIYVSDLELGGMLNEFGEEIRNRGENLDHNPRLEAEFDKAFEEWQKSKKN